MELYRLKKSEDEVTVLVGVGSPKEAGTQQGVRAAKSSQSRKGE